MHWKVPYGYYKKNILKFYLVFLINMAILGTIGWFVKQKYQIEEMQAAGSIFIISSFLTLLLNPVLFQKGIARYIEEYEKKNQVNAPKE